MDYLFDRGAIDVRQFTRDAGARLVACYQFFLRLYHRSEAALFRDAMITTIYDSKTAQEQRDELERLELQLAKS